MLALIRRSNFPFPMKDHRTKAAILASLLMATSGFAGDDDSGQEASIGRHIFLDTGLSAPVGQACVSCHNPKYAFADSRRVSPGAVDGRVGRRNAPTLMYAALIPPIVLEEFYDENGVESFAKEG
ncbi:MAG: cytochrome c peroxidase, partial [Verrucomicrobiales bacterium]